MCWLFPAEDPAVLAAEFAVLAAQLGAREVVDPRDPVASVHAVLARQQAGWLLVFDNAPDRVSVERFVPPAGPGRVLITTQNQHWPPGQALDVPVLDPGVAADFLVDRTGDSDRAAAGELARELGGLPLALEQAAALGACQKPAHWTGWAGDAAAARDQFATLLPIRERFLGPEHPDTLTTRSNLASWTG